MCDFSGLTVSSFRGLTSGRQGGSCPPHTRLQRSQRTTALRGVAAKVSGPPGWSCSFSSLHTYSSFIPGSLYLRPSAKVLSRLLCWGGRETPDSLCSALPLQLFPCHPPTPPPPRVQKTAGAFCSRLSPRWDKPHVSVGPPDSEPVHCSMVENGTGEWVLPLVLDSCLFYHSKGLKA